MKMFGFVIVYMGIVGFAVLGTEILGSLNLTRFDIPSSTQAHIPITYKVCWSIIEKEFLTLHRTCKRDNKEINHYENDDATVIFDAMSKYQR